jgi:DNA repair exonuclease SbcCD ATPase subunit
LETRHANLSEISRKNNTIARNKITGYETRESEFKTTITTLEGQIKALQEAKDSLTSEAARLEEAKKALEAEKAAAPQPNGGSGASDSELVR